MEKPKPEVGDPGCAKWLAPVIVLPEGEVSREDIEALRANFICAIEAKDPAKIRFLDPPPRAEGGLIEKASLSFVRRAFRGQLKGLIDEKNMVLIYLLHQALGRPAKLFCKIFL